VHVTRIAPAALHGFRALTESGSVLSNLLLADMLLLGRSRLVHG